MKSRIYSIYFRAGLEPTSLGDLAGFAIIAANSAEEAETLLRTQSDLRHSRIEVVEMVLLPGCEYDGCPILIKEYSVFLDN